MRYPLIIFLSGLIAYSCVKPKSNDPKPIVTFKDFVNPRKTSTGGEAAEIVLSYEDGDGDLFVDNATQGPNVVFTTYIYNDLTGEFAAHFDNKIQDTVRYSNSVRHPPNTDYKGKSIKGEITVPLDPDFRPIRTAKIITFRGFMIDQKKNRTPIFASPIYTIDF